jgi:hypothetical protein
MIMICIHFGDGVEEQKLRENVNQGKKKLDSGYVCKIHFGKKLGKTGPT